MNPFTDMLFTLIWLFLLVWAIRTMIRGYSAYTPPSNTGYSVEKKTVTKISHPEMADVQQGDELLVVKFGDVEPKDPLLQSFSDRIQTLRDEEGTTDIEEDDDEDDDGDVIVRV